MLPPLWQKITLFNPVVYLISGFRWSFYGVSDISVGISPAMILGFRRLPAGGVVDLQDRLSVEELSRTRKRPQMRAFSITALEAYLPNILPRPSTASLAWVTARPSSIAAPCSVALALAASSSPFSCAQPPST